MSDEKLIKAKIQSLETLQDIAQAYAIIASSRMKKTRESVLYSRTFLKSLSEVFNEVIFHYRKEVGDLARRRTVGGRERITFLPHNGKSVAVLLSASTGLYGQVMQDTFDLFLSEVRKKGYEATLIGRYGLSRFIEAEPSRPYTFYNISDHEPMPGMLAEAIFHLVQYEEINIFYPKFVSLLDQEPAVFNISANSVMPEITTTTGSSEKMYIFEPTLEKILVFFEREIFGSSFDQSLSESYLAKYASRMLAMDKAGENIKREMGKLIIERQRQGHYLANKKQQETVVAGLLY